jgi:hypothetical protein
MSNLTKAYSTPPVIFTGMRNQAGALRIQLVEQRAEMFSD